MRSVNALEDVLCDVGHSLEIICEHTLEENRDAFGMIVVPELYEGLTPETLESLLEYAEKGGSLVLVGRKTCEVFAKAGAPFAVDPCEEYFGLGEIAYDNGGDAGHADKSTQKHKPYYFTVDESAFGVAYSPTAIVAEGAKVEAFVSAELTGERKTLAATVPFGKGSITAVGFDMGSQYSKGAQYMHRDLMKQVTSSLYEPVVRIESALGRLEIIALEVGDRFTVQLVNAGGSHNDDLCATDDYIPPVLDIKLSIALPKKPGKLMLQPEGKELSFTYANGRAEVFIDRLEIHSVLEIVEIEE